MSGSTRDAMPVRDHEDFLTNGWVRCVSACWRVSYHLDTNRCKQNAHRMASLADVDKLLARCDADHRELTDRVQSIAIARCRVETDLTVCRAEIADMESRMNMLRDRELQHIEQIAQLDERKAVLSIELATIRGERSGIRKLAAKIETDASDSETEGSTSWHSDSASISDENTDMETTNTESHAI